MQGVVFKETLRRHWRGLMFWAIGIALIGAAQVFTLPDVSALKDYAKLMATLPPALIQAVGGGDAQFFATPAGYLASQYYGIALVIYAIYALVLGLKITTAEEDRGIMDIVLTLPIPRWRLIVERLLAYALCVLAVTLISFVCMWGSLLATPGLEIDTGLLFTATINVLPGALLVLAFTTLAGTLLRRRGTAIAVSVVFVIGSYFIDFLGAAASGSLADTLRVLSFFRYYDETSVMQHGLEWGNVAVLVVAAALCVIGALWSFERRDIATAAQ
ncbi:MAG TPA: ABC transporter permease subunit [Phototrophicaceae bacterium]|nr:ABC transporter permease subunit [Phototrophicaceae bacterium]